MCGDADGLVVVESGVRVCQNLLFFYYVSKRNLRMLRQVVMPRIIVASNDIGITDNSKNGNIDYDK